MTSVDWVQHKSVGAVRGIEVLVCSRPGTNEYHVHLFGTPGGVDESAQTFVGKRGLVKATIMAEAVLATLESAECTWFLDEQAEGAA